MSEQAEFAVESDPLLAGPAHEVLRSLRRIFHAVDRHSRQLARLHGLTEPQAICLRTIERTDWITPGQLARRVSLSPPTVTGILDRLERRGLIKRERTVRDKRRVDICLTDGGRRVLSDSPPPLQERFVRRLADLPATRQRRIAKALAEVVKLLEAEDIDAAPLLAHGAANPGDSHERPAPAGSGSAMPEDTAGEH